MEQQLEVNKENGSRSTASEAEEGGDRSNSAVTAAATEPGKSTGTAAGDEEEGDIVEYTDLSAYSPIKRGNPIIPETIPE